jgi:hypothetical protein
MSCSWSIGKGRYWRYQAATGNWQLAREAIAANERQVGKAP